jgi:hypothetical protein
MQSMNELGAEAVGAFLAEALFFFARLKYLADGTVCFLDFNKTVGTLGIKPRLPDSVFPRTTTLREFPTNTPLLLLLQARLSITAAEPL